MTLVFLIADKEVIGAFLFSKWQKNQQQSLLTGKRILIRFSKKRGLRENPSDVQNARNKAWNLISNKGAFIVPGADLKNI